MELLVSGLLRQYENGRIGRREFVQALAALGISGAAQAEPLPSRNIDHVSILVADLDRSIQFYQRVFGLTVANRDDANGIVRLRATGPVILSLRKGTPAGTIDHFAITLQGTNRTAATRNLGEAGLTPSENIEFGFHVTDPDGTVVQLWGV